MKGLISDAQASAGVLPPDGRAPGKRAGADDGPLAAPRPDHHPGPLPCSWPTCPSGQPGGCVWMNGPPPGGLLHDLYLYDPRDKSAHPGSQCFDHPRAAARNAEQVTKLSDKERNIILSHMWPLGGALPPVPGGPAGGPGGYLLRGAGALPHLSPRPPAGEAGRGPPGGFPPGRRGLICLHPPHAPAASAAGAFLDIFRKREAGIKIPGKFSKISRKILLNPGNFLAIML